MKKKSNGIVQFIKFGLVGVSNTAVDWIVYYLVAGYLITSSNLRPTVKAISFIVAVLNSYLWNTIWTFKEEYKRSATNSGQKGTIFVKFFIVSLVGWVFNYLVFKYTYQNYQYSALMLGAKEIKTQELYPLIFASAAATLWNFFANKLWTYKK